MASLGYETRELGYVGKDDPAEQSGSLLKSGDDLNAPNLETASTDPNNQWSAVQTTDETTSAQNESHIRNKLNHKFADMCGDNKWTVCKESCSLQIKATPYKSRIIQMPGYQIKKENRKWISSVSLAIILVLIGLIGFTLNLVNFKVGKMCKSKAEKVDKYLEDYKQITDYYYLEPIGPKSKNITTALYHTGVAKYSYKYKESAIPSYIKQSYLFSVLMQNDTNLTKNCFAGSVNCTLPENDQTYFCQDPEVLLLFQGQAMCVYDGGKVETEGTKFPVPYRTSEGELIDLSTCRQTKWVCRPNGKCTWCETCAWVTIDCGSVDLDVSNGLLFEGEQWDTSQYSNFSHIDYEEIADGANQILWEIYERANFLGSAYCFYMALMIFIGGPYVMTSTRLTTKIRVQLQRLSKIWFIAVLLILWYLAELVTLFWGLFIIDTDIHLILKFAMIDPCFADSPFITELLSGAAVVCGDIIYSKSLYEASRANLRYYESVEATYQYYYFADAAYLRLNPDEDIRYTYNSDTQRVFNDGDNILKDDFNLVYNYSSVDCDVTQLLNYIGPDNSDFAFGSFILFSSAIAALLLQPVLANLFKSIFIMIDPLASYWGRIEIPYQHNPNVDEGEEAEYVATDGLDAFEAGVLNEIHDENTQNRVGAKQAKEDEEVVKVQAFIKSWERKKNVCPLCCWITLLIIILISTFSVAVGQ